MVLSHMVTVRDILYGHWLLAASKYHTKKSALIRPVNWIPGRMYSVISMESDSCRARRP